LKIIFLESYIKKKLYLVMKKYLIKKTRVFIIWYNTKKKNPYLTTIVIANIYVLIKIYCLYAFNMNKKYLQFNFF